MREAMISFLLGQCSVWVWQRSAVAMRHVHRRAVILHTVVRRTAIIRSPAIAPDSRVDPLRIVRMTAIVAISHRSAWIIGIIGAISISMIRISVVVSAVGIRTIVATVVAIGRVAGGAITARRCDRGDERDWENAPGHDDLESSRSSARATRAEVTRRAVAPPGRTDRAVRSRDRAGHRAGWPRESRRR